MYKTSEFDISKAPPKPDYSLKENWAVLPDQWPDEVHEEIVGPHLKQKKADVFYIYPTLYSRTRKNHSMECRP